MNRSTFEKRRVDRRTAERARQSVFSSLSSILPKLSPHSHRILDWLTGALLLVGFAIVLHAQMHNGVVPHDTGTLAHAAERVLSGQLPHRDFDDPYTGGLSLLNAASFRLFGVSVLSMRWMLLGFTLLTFGVLYRLFRRTIPIWSAALLTAACFSWSVPNYFEPMPSWYNLFFGVFTLMALLKYAETDRGAWLMAAGVFTGFSILIKVIGLYFAAVAALFVIYLEQRRSKQSNIHCAARPLCTFSVIAGLAFFVAGIGSIVQAAAHLPGWVTFLAPTIVLAGYLAVCERRLRFYDAAARLRRLLRCGGLFFVGAAVPIVLFLIPYSLNGGIELWFDGVFVSPLRRLDKEMIRTIDKTTFSVGCIIAAVGFIAAVVASRSRTAALWSCGAIMIAFVGLMFAVPHGVIYAAFWDAARLLPLAACVGLSIHLLRHSTEKRRDGVENAASSEAAAFLFLAAAGVFGLVQYPIVNGIYFLYAAPLIIAAVWFTLSVVVRHSVVPGFLWCVIVIGFTSLWVWPGSSFLYGTAYFPAQLDAQLASRRMPLRYDSMSVEVLDSVKRVVQEHSAPGAPILAFPDTPEVYFLTQRKNPTRTFFDVFDPDYGTPARGRRLLDLLERKHVQLVVERNFTSFSTEELSDDFRQELRRRFPHRYVIQDARMRYFTIRWRDQVGDAAQTTAMSASSPAGL